MENERVNLYNIRYKNSMQPIDWEYYTKFYPEKTKAIQALRLDTGLSLREAKEVVEEIFSRFERGEIQQRPANAEAPNKAPDVSYGEDLKKAGKVTGCCLFSIFYVIFGVIFNLTGKYSGKKRR